MKTHPRFQLEESVPGEVPGKNRFAEQEQELNGTEGCEDIVPARSAARRARQRYFRGHKRGLTVNSTHRVPLVVSPSPPVRLHRARIRRESHGNYFHNAGRRSRGSKRKDRDRAGSGSVRSRRSRGAGIRRFIYRSQRTRRRLRNPRDGHRKISSIFVASRYAVRGIEFRSVSFYETASRTYYLALKAPLRPRFPFYAEPTLSAVELPSSFEWDSFARVNSSIAGKRTRRGSNRDAAVSLSSFLIENRTRRIHERYGIRTETVLVTLAGGRARFSTVHEPILSTRICQSR